MTGGSFHTADFRDVLHTLRKRFPWGFICAILIDNLEVGSSGKRNYEETVCNPAGRSHMDDGIPPPVLLCGGIWFPASLYAGGHGTADRMVLQAVRGDIRFCQRLWHVLCVGQTAQGRILGQAAAGIPLRAGTDSEAVWETVAGAVDLYGNPVWYIGAAL